MDEESSILTPDRGDAQSASTTHSIRPPSISSRRIFHYEKQPPACEPPDEPQSRSSEITTQTTREDTDVVSIEVATQLEKVSVADMSVGTCSIPSLTPAPQTVTRMHSVAETGTQTPPLRPDSGPPHAATPPSLRSAYESPLPIAPKVSDSQTQTKVAVTSRQTEPDMRKAHPRRRSVSNVTIGRSEVWTPRSSDISLDHGTSGGSSTLSQRQTMTTSVEKELAQDKSMVRRQKQVRSARARRIKHKGARRAASTSEDENRKKNTVAKSSANGRPSESDVDTTSKMSALSLIIGRCLEVARREVRDVPEPRRTSRTSKLVNTYLSRAIAEDDVAQRRDATSPLIVNYIKMSVSRMSRYPSSEDDDHFPAVNEFVRQTLAQVPVESVKAQSERRYTAASETSIFAVKACLKNAVDQLQRDAMRGHVTVGSTTSESNALAWRTDGMLTVPPVSQSVSPGVSDIVRDCLQMALDDFRGAVSRRELTREASDTTRLVRSYLERALKAVHSVMSQRRTDKPPVMSLSSLCRPFDGDHTMSSSTGGQYDRKHVMSSHTETLTEEYVRRATSARYDTEWRDAFGSATASVVVRDTLREALQTVEPSRSNTSALINAYIRQAVEIVLTTDAEPSRWAERARLSQQPSVSPSVLLINQYLQRACREVGSARPQATTRPVARRSTNGGSDSDAAAALVDAYMRAAIEECATITPQVARPLQSPRRPRTAPAPGSKFFALRRRPSHSDAPTSSGCTLASNSSDTVTDAGKRRRRQQRRMICQARKDTGVAKWTRQPAPPPARKPVKAGTKQAPRGHAIVQTSRVTCATSAKNARPKSAKAVKKPTHARDNESMSSRPGPSSEAKKYPRGRPLQHNTIVERKMIEKRGYTESTSSMNFDTPSGDTVTTNESCSLLSDEICGTLREVYRKVSDCRISSCSSLVSLV